MTDLIEMFKGLFGTYQPIQNVVSETAEQTIYSYSWDFGAITHYILVIILFWCVCKCISSIFLNFSKGVSMR